MHKTAIRQLLKKYQNGTCTPKERAIVESWYLKYNSDSTSEIDNDELEGELDLIWSHIGKHVRPKRSSSGVGVLYKWVATTAAVLFIGIVLYLFFTSDHRQQHQLADTPVDILPGGNRATLTLTDGKTLELSDAQQGVVVAPDAITYTDGSLIAGYGTTGQNAVFPSNTISTPKGGQYQITLTDGSKVWLNASSVLRYPSRFTTDKREVAIEGEAFFEIVRDASRPFTVRVNGHTIQVLGTSFNVSSYAEEQDMRITLVEGAVQVNKEDSRDRTSAVTLNPGEQAVIKGNRIDVKAVDVELYTAWKNGLFKFRETELRSVMSQLSRWYDMDVEYIGDIPDTHYYGQISRDNNLSAVLRILKGSGLNFKITKTGDTQKVTVYP